MASVSPEGDHTLSSPMDILLAYRSMHVGLTLHK